MLELSLRQGVEDVALAELVGIDPDELGSRRGRALERLAAELGTEANGRLEADLLDLWGVEAPAPAQPAEPPAEPPEEKRSRRGGLFLVLAAVAVAAGVLIGALTGGGDDERAAESGTAATRAPRTAPAAARPVRLEPLPGVTGASGSVRLQRGQRLRLILRGLPQGQYTAWLYTSIADALPLARFEGGSRSVDAKLPEEAPRFRYLDISREPADGNPNHSGQSVLRVRLDRVLGTP